MADRTLNPDNNLWYKDGEPVTPEQLEQENATATTVVPQDNGQTQELLRQIQELRDEISNGRAETQATTEDQNGDNPKDLGL